LRQTRPLGWFARGDPLAKRERVGFKPHDEIILGGDRCDERS
jgi:hypothetical protein